MKHLKLLLLFFVIQVQAQQGGMWIPSLLQGMNEKEMKNLGMKMTAADIYSVNKSSLKDAVPHFNGGCTSEVISPKGLLLTNHHCGFDAIQNQSSVDHDYLTDGFWAYKMSEELPNEDLVVTFIVKIEDVTTKVLEGTAALATELEKQKKIQENITALSTTLPKESWQENKIRTFYEGNQYMLFVTETFKDVRLVGAPPSSIGKFGSDTDNWVWPRHTGDFSVFRIYAGPDNKPAAYSDKNIPYTPIHFLPISFQNRKIGDFTMVYGFPGETEQHVASGYLKFIVEKERPARIKMREKSLSVIDAAMRSSDEVRIKYAAKQASIANSYKKWIGQVDGLKRLDAVAIKLGREEEYQKMALSKDAWNKTYGSVIDQMNKHVEQGSKWEFLYAMNIEYLFVGPELYKLARALDDLEKNYKNLEEKGELRATIEKMIKNADGFFKNYDSQVDQKIFELLTDEYLKQTANNNGVLANEKIDLTVLSKLIYSKSILTNKERYVAFLEKFKGSSLKKLKSDPGYKFFAEKFSYFKSQVVPNYSSFDDELTAMLKVYVAGKYEMFPNQKHWADANSTLRITYGKLEGSAPTDGMMYTEHTTLDGIIAKYNTGNPDFELLPRMLEMHKNKDYGDYAQNDELWVCFTGSNHTTGGNSGSPVLDANGYLMGLNFDRTWESTMSDYMFDPNRCRNVVVDIRYVLWVMDKYSGAKHLVDEMVLMKQ